MLPMLVPAARRQHDPHHGGHDMAAEALLANPDIDITQIAYRLGVSLATLDRYMPAARTGNIPGI
jgi:hypothetical protein